MKIRLSLAAFLVSLLPVRAASAADARPNVILIVTDDQGYGDLGCHGNPVVGTPHLDRLHGESARLTNYHVDPTCSPTRAALLTGRYSTRTGVWHTVMGRSLLHREEVTMADVFRSSGYRTAMIGKWHLGDNYPFRPQDRGFDETLHHGGGGIGQTPDHWGNMYEDAVYLQNGRPMKSEGYCTDVFFEHARRFVTAERERPFFLYLATNVPHAPFAVPEKYRRPYAERGIAEPMASFYGMIENMDENVGGLLAHLDELGLRDSTIVVWTTDNGTAAGVIVDGESERPLREGEGWNGFSAGMRGKKGSVYEGGHRVPCFVRWPGGGVGGGRDVDRIAAHFDLLPTLIELCGLPKPPVDFDGRSVASLLRGQQRAEPERTLFVHRQRREIPPKWENSVVLTERWRLLDGGQLYDIESDPGQEHDVSGGHPGVVAELRARYESWWESLAPALSRHAAIVVGAAQENPSVLTAMDWHNDDIRQIPWNQRQVEAMPLANGYWLIDVARAGNYEFALRHRPAGIDFPLQARQARVVVGEEEARAKVEPGTSSVTLALALPGGPAKLRTWLDGSHHNASRGAFFVEVRRLE